LNAPGIGRGRFAFLGAGLRRLDQLEHQLLVMTLALDEVLQARRHIGELQLEPPADLAGDIFGA